MMRAVLGTCHAGAGASVRACSRSVSTAVQIPAHLKPHSGMTVFQEFTEMANRFSGERLRPLPRGEA